ncbi:ribonuclease HI [Thiomicrorhabdus heinhorstiae]|uniref:ribonuclease H n=1 Tax=Thiomicrorhabdus heinhorstiae TaxID=2748010 RepID=A0ABS0BT32_9GAMM|nr:RNase H family protein [Thiomicrorhabdus heinhorstiae]MBF6057007.1 hypothetical protein [Thiomicrorhabdus heinhorstiae]
MDFRQHTPYRLNPDAPEPQTYLLNLYTDGAYFKQHRLGGWGIAIYDHQGQLLETLSGVQISESSLEMELIAAIKALQWVQQNHPNSSPTLYTDAQILLEGLFDKYPQWQESNWHSPNGNPVVFTELWQQLHQLTENLNPDIYWIKGHTNSHQNQLADQLARQSILKKPYSD